MASLFFFFGGGVIYPHFVGKPNGLLFVSLLNHASCIAFLTGFWLEQQSRGSAINGLRVLIALLIGISAVLFSVGWIELLQVIGIEHQEQELVSILTNSTMDIKILSIVFVVVLAPICEELLFRKLLLSLFLNRMDAAFAVLLSGVLFGVMHIESFTSVPPLIVFGVLLGWLQVQYRNVLLPIIAHITNNMIVVFIMI